MKKLRFSVGFLILFLFILIVYCWGQHSFSLGGIGSKSSFNLYFFRPIDLAGCTLWLAADQPQLSGYADGTAVSTWTDNSTNGINLTKSTDPTRPLYTNNAINGKPALMYNVNLGLASTTYSCERWVGTNTMTIFLVFRARPGTDVFYPWIWYQAASNNLNNIFYNGGLYFYHGGQGEGVSSVTFSALTNNTWRLLETSKSGTDHAYIRTNSVLMLDDSTVNSNLYAAPLAALYTGRPGAADGLPGEIAEFIIYNRFLTASERTNIYDYINAKYALW